MSLNERDLKKRLKSGELANLYFLYGEESYLASHYAEQIALKAVGDHPLAAFNCQKFDGQTCTVGEIEEAVEALPVMADRKCIVVRDFDFAAAGVSAQEQLLSMISDIPKSSVLVFWTYSVSVDKKKNAKWRSFVSSVDKVGSSVEFRRKTESEIVRILSGGAEKRGCKLSPDNARLMLRRCGNDLNLLLSELDKLCALADGGEVSQEYIEAIGIQNLEASVFDLSKALIQGSYVRAYDILSGLFSQREEPIAILAVLSNAYADLYRAKVAASAGVRAETLADDFPYRGREFRLRNAARDCERIPLPVLRKSLEVLADADRTLKSSRADKRTVLEQTAAKLIILSRKGSST